MEPLHTNEPSPTPNGSNGGVGVATGAEGIQSVLRDNVNSDLDKALAHEPATLEEALTQLAMVRASIRPKSPNSTSRGGANGNAYGNVNVGGAGSSPPMVSINFDSSRIQPLSIDESKLLPRGRSDSSSSDHHHTHAHSHDGGDGPHEHRGAIDDYFASSIWRILGKRLPWLVALLLLQSFSAAILHAFDELLEKNIVIAVFIPMLVGTGGNAGNQPGVMVTRALSMGSIPIRALLKREFLLACITAVILSTLGFLRVLVEYPHDGMSALVIAIALFVVILISVFLGIGFSIGLDKLKRCDPADGAAPLLTTISDLIGISCLCLISYIFLD